MHNSEPKINRVRLIDNLVALCQLSSPSRHEKPVADFIRNYAASHDFIIVRDGLEPDVPDGDSGTIILKAEQEYFSTTEALFLSAHMDTVPLPAGKRVTVIREKGILKTNGQTVLGGDDKCGIAAALEMLHLCRENPGKHRNLELVFTVQEELGCLGSRSFDTSLIQARQGFNLDGETPPGSVIYKAPYKAKYRIILKGKSSHAALAPEEGINAIKLAALFIAKLPSGQLDPETTSNIGTINGGFQTNIVPEEVILTGELRSFTSHSFSDWKKNISDICRIIPMPEGSSYLLEWETSYKGYEVNRTEPCSCLFEDACRKRDIDPVFLSSPGGGDSNNFNSMGLRNLVFGLGMHNIHSPYEYVVERELIQAVEILKGIVFL